MTCGSARKNRPHSRHCVQLTLLASVQARFDKRRSQCSATAATPRWASMVLRTEGSAAISGTCTQQITITLHAGWAHDMSKCTGNRPHSLHCVHLTLLVSARARFDKKHSPCSATAATPRWASMAACTEGSAAISGTWHVEHHYKHSQSSLGMGCQWNIARRHSEVHQGQTAQPALYPAHPVGIRTRQVPQETQSVFHHDRHASMVIQGRYGCR
jgi:hypothetical protein